MSLLLLFAGAGAVVVGGVVTYAAQDVSATYEATVSVLGVTYEAGSSGLGTTYEARSDGLE